MNNLSTILFGISLFLFFSVPILLLLATKKLEKRKNSEQIEGDATDEADVLGDIWRLGL